MNTKSVEILHETDSQGVIEPGSPAHSVVISAIEKALVAGEANYRQHLAELCAEFGVRTDGDFATLVERIRLYIQNLNVYIEPPEDLV